MDNRQLCFFMWRSSTLGLVKKIILSAVTVGIFASLPAKAQILPQPTPFLDPTLKQYKGVYVDPKVTRRYMLDFLDIYVHQYVVEFQQLNRLDSDVLNEKELITRFRKDLDIVPDSMIIGFAPISIDVLKGKLDATAIKLYPRDTYAEIQNSLNTLEGKFNQLELEVKNVKDLFQVTADNGENKVAFDFANQLVQVKTEIGQLATQLKAQQQQMHSLSASTENSAPSGESKRDSSYWIALAALTLSLITFLSKTREKKAS